MSERIRITVSVEYEPEMENYPGCSTVAEALAMDREQIAADPGLVFEFMDMYESSEPIFEVVSAGPIPERNNA